MRILKFIDLSLKIKHVDSNQSTLILRWYIVNADIQTLKILVSIYIYLFSLIAALFTFSFVLNTTIFVTNSSGINLSIGN